ncbi:DUF2470 domain-containing protein [Amycolatopsis acidiphila]|uniref:DUF2470 domain-containing protein n=1 Tax=Amycolatopsis acidiphila TaxID=715473 RepID=A0A558AMJ9_9PSEU|nr:DUF2470 domain-containing protein [Amycolatopsis acidiphila]TVT25494.1 DUF2470 domain-containing protein [Amycolatopsis acidiphila]UIJ60234.1 DUF2470 domain-containing protein [Amycolatopsis acidiphila]GHG60595.1 hypothetical protein GCM10017788_14450 [Amycolatopsis acidiphila]
MTQTSTRRPPAPAPAERAKTIATRDCPGSLVPTGPSSRERVVPELHHVHASGSVSVLLRDEHPLLARAADAEVAVMFELADHAPVDLREPVRGLLWITGWLRPLGAAAARARALAIAEARPDPRLLDLGHGASLLRLTPASLVLADAEGTHSLRPHMFSAATADPFATYETSWLRHLEHEHADVVAELARHVPEELRGGRIRPLGLDRFGLRLRVETETEDHDVRLAFSRPLSNTAELAGELRRLVGCPFLARYS